MYPPEHFRRLIRERALQKWEPPRAKRKKASKSQKVPKTLSDIAESLTPEKRAELAALLGVPL